MTPLHRIEMPRPRIDGAKVIVAAGCVYELVALWTPLPTITALVRRMRHHRVLRWAAAAWLVVWVAHFVTE